MNIVDAIGYGDDRHAAAFERDRPLRYTHTYTHKCVHHTFSICITHADIAATTPHTHTRERGVWKKRSIRARQTRPLALHTDLAVPGLVHVTLYLTQCPLSFSRGYSISVSLSPFPSLSLSFSLSLNLSLALAAVVVVGGSEIGRTIGEGSFAVVKAGRHIDTGTAGV